MRYYIVGVRCWEVFINIPIQVLPIKEEECACHYSTQQTPRKKPCGAEQKYHIRSMQTKHSVDVEVDRLGEVLQGSGEYGIAI